MPTIFHDCRMIDCVGDMVREHCDVVVDHDKVVAIEPTRARSLGEHVIVESDGMSILPGLIDCHTHYLIYPWGLDPRKLEMGGPHGRAVLRAARCARVALESGVTTARDAGAPDGLNLVLRDAINEGLIPGPR